MVVQLSAGLAQRARWAAEADDGGEAAAFPKLVLGGHLAPDTGDINRHRPEATVRAEALTSAVAVGAALDGSKLVAHLVAGAADGVAALGCVLATSTQGLGVGWHRVTYCWL